MNVLEKILEEIKEKCVELSKNHWGDDECHLVGKGIQSMYIQTEKIIRFHMDDVTDTDDTEEKIREHIAECLHRIDNIRSFVGSKKYSDDARCRKNIDVLKKSIVAMEEYLRFKKRNDNDDWIPVEERLSGMYETVIVSAKMKEDKEYLVYMAARNNLDGWMIEGVENPGGYEIVAWRPLPEPYKPKKLQTEEKPVQ